jgi:2-dehydro-3-deoxyglucarate aldolase
LKNPLKDKLKEGKVLFGTGITIAHPDVAEVMGQVGYDWVMFDMEHTPFEVADIQVLLQAMKPSASVPVVRVAWNDMVLIKRALDIGAYGIVVPWVNSKEDAERAVQAVKYPPQGLRGYGPRRASLGDPEYAKTANDEIFLAIQIETKKAVDSVEKILSVPGIDAVFIGPYDLSMSLGVFTQWDSPVFIKSVAKILASAQKHNVVPGMLAPAEWQKRVQEGFKIIMLTQDLPMMQETATKALADAQSFVNGLKA